MRTGANGCELSERRAPRFVIKLAKAPGAEPRKWPQCSGSPRRPGSAQAPTPGSVPRRERSLREYDRRTGPAAGRAKKRAFAALFGARRRPRSAGMDSKPSLMEVVMGASTELVPVSRRSGIPIANMRNVYRVDEVERRLHKLPPKEHESLRALLELDSVS